MGFRVGAILGGLKNVGVGNRPTHLDSANDVLLGYSFPSAAIRTVVAMVTHHKVVAPGNQRRTEVIVALVLSWDEIVE
jgi:hypothetical protein